MRERQTSTRDRHRDTTRKRETEQEMHERQATDRTRETTKRQMGGRESGSAKVKLVLNLPLIS